MKNTRIVSLSALRKSRDRAEAKALADANARKFGRTKAERILEATRSAKARDKLDQHRLEDE